MAVPKLRILKESMDIEKEEYYQRYIKRLSEDVQSIMTDMETVYGRVKHLHQGLALTEQNLEAEINIRKEIKRKIGIITGQDRDI